jgi:hypothetical protein
MAFSWHGIARPAFDGIVFGKFGFWFLPKRKSVKQIGQFNAGSFWRNESGVPKSQPTPRPKKLTC